MSAHSPKIIIETISKREEIISTLATGIDRRSELVDQVSVSRATVDRTLRTLEELGLVTSEGSHYRLTAFGRHASHLFMEMSGTLERLGELNQVLDMLSCNETLDHCVLQGSELTLASRSSPDKPREDLETLLEKGGNVRVISPVLDRRLIELLRDRNISKDRNTVLIIDDEIAEQLWVEQNDIWKSIISSSASTVRQVENEPPFVLMVSTDQMSLGLVDGHGIIKGIVSNNRQPAIAWADNRFEEYFEDSSELLVRGGRSYPQSPA